MSDIGKWKTSCVFCGNGNSNEGTARNYTEDDEHWYCTKCNRAWKETYHQRCSVCNGSSTFDAQYCYSCGNTGIEPNTYKELHIENPFKE